MVNNNNHGFKILLSFFLTLYLIQYTLGLIGTHSIRMPLFVNVVIYIVFFVAYLIKYRKDNLLCFELMAIPVAFLGLFFKDVINPILPEFMSLYSIASETEKMKSEDIQMIAFFALLIGCSVSNDKRNGSNFNNLIVKHTKTSYNLFIVVLSVVLMLLIIYDYRAGVFSSWFYYSHTDIMEVTERNEGLGHLTCLLLVATCVELVRLREKGISNLKNFIVSINKLYFVECLGISFLLFISGNRNEMLLIILPIVIGYTICIKKIPNKILIISMLVGVLLMAVAGMSRQDSVSLRWSAISLFSLTRDFSGLGYNTDYLIEYTDNNGTSNFGELPNLFLSGIPYFGYQIIQAIDLKGPKTSAVICDDSVIIPHSGFGTSLIGDLYYTAGLLWVIVFMYGLGFLLARLYYSNKNINIYWLLFYTYMVANAVYYIRSSWAFPITILEYSMIILLIGQLLFRKK